MLPYKAHDGTIKLVLKYVRSFIRYRQIVFLSFLFQFFLHLGPLLGVLY